MKSCSGKLKQLVENRGYTLWESEYKSDNLFISCQEHGIFITSAYDIICHKCYKDIPGFKNYLISKTGNIYSLNLQQLLTINIEYFKNKKKYIEIKLVDDNKKRKSMFLHKLLALTYITNPDNKREVHHKDENIYNNYSDNLEWCTTKERIAYSSKLNSERIKTRNRIKNHDTNNKELANMKELQGYENYLISKDAKVYSKSRRKYMVINLEKLKLNKKRVTIKLCATNGKRKCFYLNQLIAQTYIPNPDNKREVNHIDGNLYNNNLENLEWCTNQENMDHAFKNNLVKPADNRRKVSQYDINGKYIRTYNGIKEAALKNNIHYQSIKDCLRGKIKISNNFIWKYTTTKNYNDEIWKDVIINGTNTGYKISNSGKCKNQKRKILKGIISSGNYIHINLTFNINNIKSKIRKSQHYLVANAFIPNPENKPEVDHIDTNVQNNKVENLRWYTHKENMNNEITKQKLCKLVIQKDENGNVLNEFNSITEAKEYMKNRYNITGTCISKVCNKQKNHKTVGGFFWEFKKKLYQEHL